MNHTESRLGGSLIRRFFALFLVAGLTACDGIAGRSYRLVLPDLPPAWQALLGDAHWSVEWIDDTGMVQTAELSPLQRDFGVTVVNDASSPILACPYWPERRLRPGDMKPAGALFPWDVRDGAIVLSWRGGVDAFFWRGLSRAGNDKREAVSFNWKRWREAWNDGSFPPAAVLDPWRCDWESIAAKIAASGFDKRRIIVVNYPLLLLSGEIWQGTWYGPSPFDTGTSAAPGEPLLLPLVPPAATVFGDAGLVRYSAEGVLLCPWDE
jgi:hypothetical protein